MSIGISVGSIPLIKLKVFQDSFILEETDCNKLADKVISEYLQNIINVNGVISAESVQANYNLVYRLCEAKLWDKFSEIGTFSGGNLASSLVKLKYDNVPVLQSFNYIDGSFSEKQGLASNTTNNYLDTSASLDTLLGLSTTNLHLSIYIMNIPTTSISLRGYMGVTQGSSRAYIVQRNNVGEDQIESIEGIALNSDCSSIYRNPPTSRGLWTMNNTPDYFNRLFLNDTLVGVDNIESQWRDLPLPSLSIYLNAIQNTNNNAIANSESTIGFYSLGQGLIKSDMQKYYLIYKIFLEELGRDVY